MAKRKVNEIASKWRAKAAAAVRKNGKSLATFRPESPKAMTGPIRPKARFDDHGRSLIECDTKRQLRLYFAANKLLATAGFFAPQEQFDDAIVLPSEAIGVNGLRPTWHGRP